MIFRFIFIGGVGFGKIIEKKRDNMVKVYGLGRWIKSVSFSRVYRVLFRLFVLIFFGVEIRVFLWLGFRFRVVKGGC